VLRIFVDRLADKMAVTNPAVYRSEFDWQSYPGPWVGLFEAFHGLDVCFNFDSFAQSQPNLINFVVPSLDRQVLSNKMLASIRGFMETGDPNKYLGALWPALAYLVTGTQSILMALRKGERANSEAAT